jgi:hypothetical protein
MRRLSSCVANKNATARKGELEKLLAGVREVRAEAQQFTRDREDFYRDPDSYSAPTRNMTTTTVTNTISATRATARSAASTCSTFSTEAPA